MDSSRWPASLPHDLTRLRLRVLRSDDLDAFFAYRNNPSVARYQGWDPMDRDAARIFLKAQASEPLLPGHWRQFAVADRGTDALVGDIGVWLAADGTHAEFGITISPVSQGLGYGAECVAGLVRLLFATTSLEKVVASADIRNVACIAMLGRAGMIRAGTRDVEYKGEQCTEVLFVQRRDEA